MRYVVLLGRICFAAIFIVAAPGHFKAQEIAYAAQAGVPLASLAVPVSGLMALAGGLSIALGYRTKIGAWLLVLFLVPVTLTMHNFWAATDPTMAQLQMAMFMKNVGLLGGALLLAYYGAGPLSVDARRQAATPRIASIRPAHAA
jgi:putative oxidoreductase